MRHKIRYVLPAIVSSFTVAHAQTDDHAEQLVPLVVTGEAAAANVMALDVPTEAASRLGLTHRENPVSVAVADRALMEQIGARDLQDAVNILPGVNLASLPGNGAFVSYRGFASSQVNQLFNGIPLAYVIAARPVNAWIYDRVEAVGGPSSFLYGASSVGGSLNYVTKTAERVEQEITGRLSYGSFDTTESAFGINRALNENNWFRFDYSHNTSKGYIDDNDKSANTMALSWLTDISNRLSHTLAIEYQEETVDSPYWGTPTLNPQIGTLSIDKGIRHNNYNAEDGLYEQRVRWLRSVTDYQWSDNTALRNTFYHYRAERDYRNLESYRYNATNTQLTRSGLYLQRHEQELTGNRLELTHHGELFGRRSDWAMGLDYNVNHHTGFPTPAGTTDVVDPYQFDAGYIADFSTDALREGRSNRVKMMSVFVENRQGLTDRLSLISALRYDHIDFSLIPSPGDEKRTSQWNTVSGRLGLVFDINDDTSIYAQYSTSAEPPGGTLTTSSNQSIDDFDISDGRQYEIGSKFHYWNGRGQATIAAYHIVRKDFLTRDPNNPNQFIQVGQQTSNGLEIASSLQLTPTLTASANVAFVDAQYDAYFEGGVSYEDKTPRSVPKRVANLWLVYTPHHDWELGLGSRYVDAVYANSANTQKLPSYTLFDAFATYSLSEHIDVTLRGRNLSDKVYAYTGSRTQYYVAEPRSVELSLDLKY